MRGPAVRFVAGWASVDWIAWMGVIAAVGAVGAAVWLTLVRRAQVR